MINDIIKELKEYWINLLKVEAEVTEQNIDFYHP